MTCVVRVCVLYVSVTSVNITVCTCMCVCVCVWCVCMYVCIAQDKFVAIALDRSLLREWSELSSPGKLSTFRAMSPPVSNRRTVSRYRSHTPSCKSRRIHTHTYTPHTPTPARAHAHGGPPLLKPSRLAFKIHTPSPTTTHTHRTHTSTYTHTHTHTHTNTHIHTPTPTSSQQQTLHDRVRIWMGVLRCCRDPIVSVAEKARYIRKYITSLALLCTYIHTNTHTHTHTHIHTYTYIHTGVP